MKRVAFVCPGQGVQQVGMGRAIATDFPAAAEVFARASAALGQDVARLCFEGPEDQLVLTANTQPALLTVSVAIARVLEQEGGIQPVIAAGHSLGEWSALVIAGALQLEDALRAVRMRGEAMQIAVPSGLGAMAALVGTDAATAAELCAIASQSGDPGAAPADLPDVVVPANLNGPGQIVVSGYYAAVDRLESLAAARKIRMLRLPVSAPFHSPLMQPARVAMQSVIDALPIAAPGFPVLRNVDAAPHGDPADVRQKLLEQITAPVLWSECSRAIGAAADLAVEIGPGRVLTGLLKRIDGAPPCMPTGDTDGVRRAIEAAERL